MRTDLRRRRSANTRKSASKGKTRFLSSIFFARRRRAGRRRSSGRCARPPLPLPGCADKAGGPPPPPPPRLPALSQSQSCTRGGRAGRTHARESERTSERANERTHTSTFPFVPWFVSSPLPDWSARGACVSERAPSAENASATSASDSPSLKGEWRKRSLLSAMSDWAGAFAVARGPLFFSPPAGLKTAIAVVSGSSRRGWT